MRKAETIREWVTFLMGNNPRLQKKDTVTEEEKARKIAWTLKNAILNTLAGYVITLMKKLPSIEHKYVSW